jgi:hypothetical protein
MRRVAEGYIDTLERYCLIGGVAVGAMLIGRAPHDPLIAGEWYAMSAATMANSRLLLADSLGIFSSGSPGLGFRAETTSIGLDFSEMEPAKAGVHLREDIREELELEPLEIGQEVWYEGEEVFIRARRRAKPSDKFTREWWRFYGAEHPFRRRDFTTFVPRLKRHIWEQGKQLT